MNRLLFLILLIISFITSAQDNRVITGKVLDSVSKEPLAFATIEVHGFPDITSTNQYGDFSILLPVRFMNDSITVRYIGYKTLSKKIAELEPSQVIYLSETYVLLHEIVISHKKLNIKKVENNFINVRDNLYAMETEVKNEDYNLFLSSLEENNQTQLFKQCDYDLNRYSKSEREFYRRYSGILQPKTKVKDTVDINYSRYPAVNITHDAAVKYCEWLTERYNSDITKTKKKFKKVKFRLPTLNEWQITALGYPKFQSWNLTENKVEVVINKKDSVTELPRGKKIMIPVGVDILYPWWEAYYYRNKPTNSKNCFLGNFKILPPIPNNGCFSYFHSYDGWSRMSPCGAYFPNPMGFYDVVGNIAEMIDEKGKACGGSWDDIPAESTLHSVKNYKHADASIGFRVFMEVIEK